MARSALALAALGLLAAAPLAAGAGADMAGVGNPAQARIDYMLKCQGCHQPDGRASGGEAGTPALKGEVARFLHVPGGREFLARVPGVATTDLDSARVAQVLNWTLHRFDAGNLPGGFKPYTAEEIARLRSQPLRLERAEMRAALVARMGAP
jgi:mono/diheme cytochrome c family protein